jgi:hypothetical protein
MNPTPIRIPFKTAFEIVWTTVAKADPEFLKLPDAKAVLSHWLLAPDVRPPLLPKIFEDENFVREIKSALADAAVRSEKNSRDNYSEEVSADNKA